MMIAAPAASAASISPAAMRLRGESTSASFALALVTSAVPVFTCLSICSAIVLIFVPPEMGSTTTE
jgi:hypothetical protein